MALEIPVVLVGRRASGRRWGGAGRAAGEAAAAAADGGDAAWVAPADVVALDVADDRVGVRGAAGVTRQPQRGAELLVEFEVRAALVELARAGHRVAGDAGADGAAVAALGAGLTEDAPAAERAGVGDGVAGDGQVHRRAALAGQEADPGLVGVLVQVIVRDRQRLGDRALGEDADVVAVGAGVGGRRRADGVAVHRAGQRPGAAVLVDGDAG